MLADDLKKTRPRKVRRRAQAQIRKISEKMKKLSAMTKPKR